MSDLRGRPDSGRWEVLALRYASRTTSREDIFYRYHQYGEPDAPQEMAYYVWVLRNGDATILVDTGFSAEGGRRRARGHLIPPLEALAGIGVTPESVDLVVNTHLHYDHTGHLARFAGAPLLVSETELRVWTGPMAQRVHYAAHIEPTEVNGVAERAAAGDVTFMSGEHMVAEGVAALEVGGHSPGQTILFVEGERGPVVLASDSVHYYEEVELDRACGVLVDLEAVYRTYDTIRDRLAERGSTLLAGHDPLVMERFEPLRGDAGAFAVRVA